MLLIGFQVDIFLSWFPQLLKSRPLKFVLRKDEEKRVDTNVDNATLTQVFLQHHVLRFITPSDMLFSWQLAKDIYSDFYYPNLPVHTNSK